MATLSYPLRTLAIMSKRISGERGGECATGATARCGRSRPGTLGGELPEIAFVGSTDAVGRVLSLVNALVAELGSLSLDGSEREVLRGLVAALGRVRAGADAAEARTVTALEGLRDGGDDAAEVLRCNTGSSQREARRRRQRAGSLAEMPNVTEALAKGDISPEHADALARAAVATSAEAVDGDAGLLAQVAGVPADRAGRHIQVWTQRNQDPADLHQQHLRQRRRRRLHFGDGDDGMLMAHAAFDRVMGAQFRSLINGIADRIWRAEGGRDNPNGRTVEQRRLDALAIAVGLQPAPTVEAYSEERRVGDGPGPATGGALSEQERGGRSRRSGKGGGLFDEAAVRQEGPSPTRARVTGKKPAAGRSTSDGGGHEWQGGRGTPTVPPRHQIVVVASADVVSGKDPQARCEIPGMGPIPQTELERLACDAELFGLLFDGEGEPLWHGRGERTVTDAQRRALVARDGACVLCAAEPAWCEAHHVVAWAPPGEGPTDIDNLALLCTTCHHRLHDHKRVLIRTAGGEWATAPDPRYGARDARSGDREQRFGDRAARESRHGVDAPVTAKTPSSPWVPCRVVVPSLTIDVSGWDQRGPRAGAGAGRATHSPPGSPESARWWAGAGGGLRGTARCVIGTRAGRLPTARRRRCLRDSRSDEMTGLACRPQFRPEVVPGSGVGVDAGRAVAGVDEADGAGAGAHHQ